MYYRYMIIYQKHNGELLYRVCKTIPKYKKGDTTSMGWKVLDIKHLNNGKVYSSYEYDNKLTYKRKISNITTLFNNKIANRVVEMILFFVVLKVFL